jgi:hypothetical protein
MKKLIAILAAVVLVFAFTVPTMAAEWNFYGSARMATFWTTYSEDPASSGVSIDDVDDLQWDQQGNSRIGANVKVNDEIGGRFEYGDSPNKRIHYGTYNFGGGQLLVGQTYTPSVNFLSNSVFDGDGDLLGVGSFYNSRRPMIQLSMAGFKVALIQQATGAALGTQETTLPKIEASYKFSTDMFHVTPYVGYQTYEEKNTAIGDEDIDSWVVGLGGGVNVGPVFFNAAVHASQNAGNYGQYNPGSMADEAAIIGGKLVDNDGLGYLAVLGFKASDKITIELGYGYQEHELDTSGAKADETTQYYVNLTYVITPGFFIVPEIGMIDFEDDADSLDEDELLYYGLKWQINF